MTGDELLDFLRGLCPLAEKGRVSLVRELEDGSEEPVRLPDGATAYVGEHPEGPGRGGYVPTVELPDGTCAYWAEPDGFWHL